MPGYNRVIEVGNLTRDPKLKWVDIRGEQKAVANLGLAVNTKFGRREDTLFIDVEVWGKQAENCKEYLSKGSLALVEGRLKLDSWETDDGSKRNKISIVADKVTFLPKPGDSRRSSGPAEQEENEGPQEAPPEEEPGEAVGEGERDDEDVPF